MALNKAVDGVLIDISGTLLVGDDAVPGSQNALNRFIGTKVPFRFVSNTTKESRQTLLNHLKGLGFAAESDAVFTSLTAAKHEITRRGLRPLLLLEPDALQDFSDVDSSEPNAVVIGLAPSRFHYDYLNDAFRLLLSGAPLIGIHKGRYYKRPDGLALGPGPFVSALEYAASCQAQIIGKPNKEFFQKAIEDLQCPPNASTFMIGDDVRDDIAGAQAAGIKGILVKTGKYMDGDENLINPPPYAVCNDFAAAVDLIIQLRSSTQATS